MNKKKLILIILVICIMLAFPFITASFIIGVKETGKTGEYPNYRITTTTVSPSFRHFYFPDELNTVYIDKYVDGTDIIAATLAIRTDKQHIDISFHNTSSGQTPQSMIYAPESDNTRVPYQYIEYTYPDANTVQVCYGYDQSDEPFSENTIIYYYDDNQNLIKREDYSKDTLTNHYTFEYDANGYLIKEQHYSYNELELTKTYEYTYRLN